MSCLVTRPPIPVPAMSRMSSWCSAAIFRTTGDERVRRSSSAVISERGLSAAGSAGAVAAGASAAGAGGAAAGAGWVCSAGGASPSIRYSTGGGAAAGAAAGTFAARSGGSGAAAAGAGAVASFSAAITPTTLFTATVVPGATRISFRTPAAGDGISASTLSVDISNSGSSRSTRSPTFFIHFVTVPSAIDSPICGMMTSAMALPSLAGLLPSSRRRSRGRTRPRRPA